MFRAVLFCVAVVTAVTGSHAGSASAQSAEVRALWVLRTSLGSPDSISRMVTSAASSGFNTLFVQVRGRGDAFFNDGVEVRSAALTGLPAAFDPLAETLRQARLRGLRVHAWVNVNLVSSAAEFPASREHVVYQHPEWLAVPRELAGELLAIDPRSPEYLGRLSRWTRTQSERVEGLYVSPLHTAASIYIADVVRDLATRYELDGVHLDYIRYPGPDFDYSRGALDSFRREMQNRLPPAERAALDAVERIDPFAYPNELPEEWRLFRQTQLTGLVTRLYSTIKAVRPSAIVSAAVVPNPVLAQREKLQDWRTWVDAGFLDALCPMAYTTDPQQFADEIAEVRSLSAGRPLWAGIGAYRLAARDTVANIATARRLGAAGVVLFSYDSLISPPNGTEYLSAIARVFTGSL